MKKKLLIVLGTFFTLVIVAAVGAVVKFWPYISAVDFSIVTPSNIKALYQGLTETPEQTAEKKKQLDSERSKEIREYISMEIREYTEEELRQIEAGEKSETEILAQIITDKIESEKSTEGAESGKADNTVSVQPSTGKVDEKPTAKETPDAIVARHVSSLYKIQGEFESRVASLASSASNWVKAYKKAHAGITWRDAKVAGVQYFSGTASSIEAECYARVDDQIEILKSELKAVGADTSIADTIKSTAYSEMDARKAQIVQEGYAKLNKKD